MLNEEELKDAALLVFANKQDQPGAKGAGEISEALRLGELRDRNWSIMACSAVDGSGVNEGMDWLVVNPKTSITKGGNRTINTDRLIGNRVAGVRQRLKTFIFCLGFTLYNKRNDDNYHAYGFSPSHLGRQTYTGGGNSRSRRPGLGVAQDRLPGMIESILGAPEKGPEALV